MTGRRRAVRVGAALATLLAGLLAAGPGRATVPLEGTFLAERSCPAFQSFRRGTNPGEASIAAGERYPLLGANARPASHYLLRIEGAHPPDRWVAADCGRPVSSADARAPDRPAAPGAWRIPADDYVLAVSWQPAFCETAPDRRECRTRRALSADGERLALHGLWFRDRDRIDCPTRGGPRIDRATRRALEDAMPGTRSRLEVHQWEKHGACFGVSAEDYFSAAVFLLDRVARSQVGDFFSERTGTRVSAREVRDAFDGAFGRGAGERVALVCDRDGRRTLLRELRIHLSGELAPAADVSALLAAAPRVRARCDGGVVDPAGLQ